jgi:hypothetical protein
VVFYTLCLNAAVSASLLRNLLKKRASNNSEPGAVTTHGRAMSSNNV